MNRKRSCLLLLLSGIWLAGLPGTSLAQGRSNGAFTGIYSLQALIEFDSLEAAAVDGDGNLSLFGTRASKERKARTCGSR
jgi:hypothetical protein